MRARGGRNAAARRDVRGCENDERERPLPDSNGYRTDLAYIHDVGFGHFAREAAPGLLDWLSRAGVQAQSDGSRRVVDLGCGSGLWCRALADAGYEPTGFDLSPAMIRLARKRVPEGQFRCQSFLRAKLPACLAVTALGEVFNYWFDRANSPASLASVFARIYRALQPRGLFIFDVATAGRLPGGSRRNYWLGEDWACLVHATEDSARQLLVREITSFRRVGRHFRRDHEVHRLRLLDRAATAAALTEAGFKVRMVRGYGKMRFPPGWIGFVARKPG
jgi:SAM-dependent methyltransferase